MKRFMMAAAIGLVSLSAQAFDPDLKALEDPTLMQKYPSGSLVGQPAKAERAMADLDKAKKYLNDLADYSDRRCGENFFVNSCRDDVRRAKMRQEKRLYLIETEAQRVLRAARAEAEARKQAERDAKAATPPKPIKPAQSRAVDVRPDSADRVAKRQAQIEEREQAAREKAAREADNRAKYEQKLKDHEAKVKAREEKMAKRAAKHEKNAGK